MTQPVLPLEPATAGARDFLARSPKQHLIGGTWVSASSGRSFATVDPANGRHLADLAEGTSADVDAAVSAARAAFEGSAWRDMAPSLRGRLLWRIADTIDAHADELAELETLDQGKPLKTSRFADFMRVLPTRFSAPRFPPRSLISRRADRSSPTPRASRWAWWPRSHLGIRHW